MLNIYVYLIQLISHAFNGNNRKELLAVILSEIQLLCQINIH